LSNYSTLHLALRGLSFGRDRVNLVDEQQARRDALWLGSTELPPPQRKKKGYLCLLEGFT